MFIGLGFKFGFHLILFCDSRRWNLCYGCCYRSGFLWVQLEIQRWLGYSIVTVDFDIGGGIR